MSKGKYGFHFSNGVLAHEDGSKPREVKEGVTHYAKTEGGAIAKKGAKSIEVCGVGLHASEKPQDAYSHVKGNTVAYVYVEELATNCNGYTNKFAGRKRTYVKVLKLTQDRQVLLRSLWHENERGVVDSLVKKWLGVK
jgi:hypothetical protein